MQFGCESLKLPISRFERHQENELHPGQAGQSKGEDKSQVNHDISVGADSSNALMCGRLTFAFQSFVLLIKFHPISHNLRGLDVAEPAERFELLPFDLIVGDEEVLDLIK